MRFNSSIKPKKGKCVDCTDGREKYLTAGRCSFHYQKYRAKENAAKKGKVSFTYNKPISKHKPKKKDQKQEVWFKEREAIVAENPFCWECGAFIPEEYYRHAIAHIFPKAQFPSVATAKWNYVIAAAGCGCHNKTHRLDTFSRMRLWPTAVKRYKTFKPRIKETHKYHDLFKKHIV